LQSQRFNARPEKRINHDFHQLFFDANSLSESSFDSTSFVDPRGVAAVVLFASLLVAAALPREAIGVSSMFLADAAEIRRHLDLAGLGCVRVSTVGKFRYEK